MSLFNKVDTDPNNKEDFIVDTKQTLTTKQVIIRIAVIISVVELLIMLFLGLMPNKLDTVREAILDTILLMTLSTPFIYIWVIRPFVITRDQAILQVTHMALHDPLTKLANRSLLYEYLKKVLAANARHKIFGALLFIDLDDFKSINDTHGHKAGDTFLIEAARRLLSLTRSEDLVCRIGGDEFIILIQRLDTDKRKAAVKVSEIAEKLQKLICEPVYYEDIKLSTSSSIGIRILGIETHNIDKVVNEADAAMYRAKQTGKGKIVFSG